MKKQLFTISCIFVAAQLAGATDATLSLDDALYKGVGSEVTQPVTVQPDTIGEVMFDNATFIFTVDAKALAAAADKYSGQTIVLAYYESDWYTQAYAVQFDGEYIRTLPGYLSEDTYKTVGNYGVQIQSLEAEGLDTLGFTIRGLTTDGGGSVGIRYAYTATIGNSSSSNYMNWRNNVKDDFAANTINGLTLNEEFVTSYYLFGELLTETEARNLTKSAIESAPTLSAVPEPTTATLSLLALAGLAARRRRK